MLLHCTGLEGSLQKRLPACSTASVNRKSTSGSNLLFGSEAAQGIPPPLLIAPQTPNTIPMMVQPFRPPYPGKRASSLSKAEARGARTQWRGCTCRAQVAWPGGASVKQGARDGEPHCPYRKVMGCVPQLGLLHNAKGCSR